MSRTHKHRKPFVDGYSGWFANLRVRHNAGRYWWRAERSRTKQTLRGGVEPPPSRPRHSIRYDWW